MKVQRRIYAEQLTGEQPLPRKICGDLITLYGSLDPNAAMVIVGGDASYVPLGSWIVWDAGEVRVLSDEEFREAYEL